MPAYYVRTRSDKGKGACTTCVDDRLENKCKNPHKCAVAVNDRLDQVLLKWDPRTPELMATARNALPSGEVRFTSPPEIENLAEGYRIFTKSQPMEPACELVMVPMPIRSAEDVTNAAISKGSQMGAAKARGLRWVADGVAKSPDPSHNYLLIYAYMSKLNDPRNIGFRIHPSAAQSELSAEVIATLYCVQSSPGDVPLRISVHSDAIPTILNKNLGKWEDRGWVDVPNKMPIQALAMSLRKRQADTIFVKLRSSGASLPYRMASQLSKEGAENGTPRTLDMSTTVGPHLQGAKLATLTQALAYKAIKQLRLTPSRKTTEANIKLVQDAGLLQRGKTPTIASIWKSVRHKDLSRQIKTFLWKSIHGAHRVGKFWTNIPGYEDRATCDSCGELETIEHILLECEAPGQAEIWKLAGEFWAKKLGVIPPPWGESWDAVWRPSSRRRSRSHQVSTAYTGF
ncbi:hypothetical protein DFH06DRAFT_1150446 [Mycena polygramma]|nr:hypothetical protein DFH06DRAFT_1150446 [Mycena polygramma]